ncbi:Cysteine synthase 2 [Ophidiomyces ophidiicola]|nr:Cysteine synthase 2 [Ophidiomyces ophidiicola]KAI1974355.1 Cysteine synthase 2 [Ophidiomyces ophidiicola]KAI1979061.1 Cysteine synthase 2 [Ophidiomyces ophidiicola]KAI1983306.1 Cysteine synthase 2 [Ophidiomyces ophidiicola]
MGDSTSFWHMPKCSYSGYILPVGFFTAGAIFALRLRGLYFNNSIKQPKPNTSNNDISGHSRRNPPPPIVDGIEGCIGNTPLIRIKSLSEATGCEILGKAEFLNGAGGSPKDRVALNIIQMAERQGRLTPHSGDVIYEGTVGSTGISLATLARASGYSAHICMPSDQSTEKSNLLLKLGAVVERVPPAPIVEQGHFVNRARDLAKYHGATAETLPVNTKGRGTEVNPESELRASIEVGKCSRGFFADQFENPANWQAHFHSTGPEIFEQCKGTLDAFVSGAGTGGTISGVALYLKPRLPTVKIVLADPQGSGLFNRIRFGVMFDVKEREGARRRRQIDTVVEGIGINRITGNFEAGRELIDDAIRVNDAQAKAMARWLVEKDGIFVGSSSAVNCFAALKMALKLGPGHRIVTLLCDSGTRHLSRFWADAGEVGDAVEMKLQDLLQANRDGANFNCILDRF